jgi:lipoprotein-anchoring transpeptidase ErfK/SrfK
MGADPLENGCAFVLCDYVRSGQTTRLGFVVPFDQKTHLPLGKRARIYGARGGLGRAAASLGIASLGLTWLGGASAVAYVVYPDFPYGQYPGAAPDRRSVRASPFDPTAAKVTRKRQDSTKTADPSKPGKPSPPKPAGPLIIAVSIGSQHLTVYDNGAPIATAPISSGMQGHLTPMGVFSVIQKERWHRSNLYSNAPMPFMQRITWSGVAMHAGVLPGYPASHGCIRMPESFAVRLWGMTRVGARVVVTRNDVAPYRIDHPRLAGLEHKSDPPSTAANASAGVTTAQNTTGAEGPQTAKDATDGTIIQVVSLSGGIGAGVASSGAAERPVGLRAALDASTPDEAVPLPLSRPADIGMRSGPISLFVSRKEGKLFVRKGFAPVFDTPVTIARRDTPLGTHVFTASEAADGGAGLRWLAISIANDRAAVDPEPVRGKSRGPREFARPVAPSSDALQRAAVEALDRIELPQEAIDRIAPLMTVGASLLISDQGLGDETGRDTDFIVVTK